MPHPDIQAPQHVFDLAGPWEYRPDPKGFGEHYAGQLAYTHAEDERWMKDVGTIGWTPIDGPGPWPEQLAGAPTPVWFRRRFQAPADSEAWRLTFLGVNYRADVWLNGRYLGTHENYFAPFSFDVTDLLVDDNLLVVLVAPASDVLGEEDEMGQFKRDFVGALGRWDMNDPERKPAGIWAGVELVAETSCAIVDGTLTVAFDRLPDRSDLDAPLRVYGAVCLHVHARRRAPRATLRWAVAPVGFADAVQEGDVLVALLPGRRPITFDVDLQVRPWWTWDLGEPRLYEVTVWLEVEGQIVDTRAWRTGFRELSIGDGWDLRLNGVSLYQRGANYLSDLDLSSMTRERYRLDVELFKSANLNTVHPFCIVESPGLYDECDRQGLIVYQDIPLWLMVDTSSETVVRAISTFDEMLHVLGRHPSVAIWNFGSQPSIANFEKLCAALVRHARITDASRIAHHGNAAVSYEPHDDVHPTRSFFWPRREADRFVREYGWRRDNHMYPGWYFGDLTTIAELPREDFHLVTEFGGQSLPDASVLAEFMNVDGPIDWRAIARRCGQPSLLRRHNPHAETLDELIASSQAHQAKLIRHHAEFIRSLKGEPSRGLHVFAFNDCWPAVTWSIVDYYRNPKPAYHALATAMQPVQAFLRDPERPRRPGHQLLEVSVVNDGPSALENVTLSIVLVGDRGESQTCRSILLDVPTDRAVHHSVSVDVPASADGADITLELSWDENTVRNCYCLR
jgi:beta-mannosidase